MSAQRSIVIGGGAFAGLALALALRQGLGTDVPVIVADPALGDAAEPRSARDRHRRRLPPPVRGHRGVGPGRAAAQPILDMVVTDSKLQDATRPVFLTFAANVEPGEPFAHMIENRYLIDALVKRAEADGIELRATAVARSMTPARRHRRDLGRRPRDRGEPPGRRRRRALEIARTRRHCAPMAGTTISPASSSRSAMSAIITAGPRSISFPPARSRSCR